MTNDSYLVHGEGYQLWVISYQFISLLPKPKKLLY
jgi:hypothetical protein